MTATILVGASGWFGRRLLAQHPDAIVVAAREVLATDGAALRRPLDDGARIVLNAAGSRQGSPETMQQLNVVLPGLIAREVARAGGHLVHLGSAAEYGTRQPGGWCLEEATAAPESTYGRTKLAGTQVALDSGSATVLRVFNMAASPPQDGSPLADVAGRIRAAVAAGNDVPLLSAGTVRDWVSPAFVCESVDRAAADRLAGLYNLCSGHGVEMGEAVRLALGLLGSSVGVGDLAEVPASAVVGRPDRWTAATGLGEQLTSADLAEILRTAAA